MRLLKIKRFRKPTHSVPHIWGVATSQSETPFSRLLTCSIVLLFNGGWALWAGSSKNDWTTEQMAPKFTLKKKWGYNFVVFHRSVGGMAIFLPKLGQRGWPQNYSLENCWLCRFGPRQRTVVSQNDRPDKATIHICFSCLSRCFQPLRYVGESVLAVARASKTVYKDGKQSTHIYI